MPSCHVLQQLLLSCSKKKKGGISQSTSSPLHELWQVFYRAIPVPQMISHYLYMNIPSVCSSVRLVLFAYTLMFTYIFKVSTFSSFYFVFIYISYFWMYLKVLLSLNRFYASHSLQTSIHSNSFLCKILETEEYWKNFMCSKLVFAFVVRIITFLT